MEEEEFRHLCGVSTVRDGSGEEFNVVGMFVSFVLESADGYRVTLGNDELARLVDLQPAIGKGLSG